MSYALRSDESEYFKKLEAKRKIRKLIKFLAHANANKRAAAAAGLGRLGDKRAVEPLCAALADTGPDDYWVNSVNIAAAEALWRIGDSRGAKLAINYLLEHAHSSSINEAMLEALQSVQERLRSAADTVDADILRNIARLNTGVTWARYESCEGAGSVDCAQIRQMARQELIRRDLPDE